MEITKTVLTYNELKTIIDDCLSIQEPLFRKLMKDMYLIKYTTGIEVPDEVSTTMWDKYSADGTIQEIYEKVTNIYIIDDMIKESESFESTMIGIEGALINFLEQTNKLFEKTAKSLPKSSKGWDKFMNNFKEVMDYGNKRPDGVDDTATESTRPND